MAPDVDAEFVTIEAAAIIAGVPVATVLAWIREGLVRALPFWARVDSGSLMYCHCVDPLPDPGSDCCLLCGGVVKKPEGGKA